MSKPNERKPERTPQYVKDAAKLGGGLEPGVHHVEVHHRPHCDLLSGRGACNCNPDVRLVRPS